MLKKDLDDIKANLSILSRNSLSRDSALVETKRLLEKIKLTNDSQQINKIINKLNEDIKPVIPVVILQEDPFASPDLLPPILNDLELVLEI